ncbi:hypothetical protein Lser_V15G39064 [Lactuca serriola]
MMMMMGGVELHQELKNLCVNSDWKYAAFWKLNHGDRMILTCEDVYCNTDDDSYADNLVELAIVQMSYSVYSIGEGIIGQVAATGKHVWKSGHQLVNSPNSLDGHFDEWKTQFTSGIRTFAVMAVAPFGVIQLGSLKTMAEDLKLMNHIKEIFSHQQTSLMVSTSTDSSPCVTELSTNSGHVNNHNRSRTMNNRWNMSDFICNDQNQNLFMPITSETETEESLKFPAGCELYEALGPAFCNSFNWDTVTTTTTTTTETLTVDKMPEETSSSKISGSQHLLEAVVAKGRSTSGSGCYSIDMEASYRKVEGLHEQVVKVGKKRARPRPRDRQMIQDRIKELRQLVPNGSKCSIDSLLEQTIKHMLFMQCVTKHTHKINKSADFKSVGKEKQGSSWAMEVGNDLKLCPIIVENIGVDGQMLVKMMCDECVDFLEMTEAIRSLGLTILKGVTDVYGDKTWMCFVVEGDNNRNIHRVDILWSLLQIWNMKTST